ncbi:MAG: NUDIX hydrolase [Candidatus Pacebacteria bacterium]|nr:NUDIX hydrolase [Candidatus Paceibacterota bacterium]
MINIEKVLGNTKKRLERDEPGAVATGIGIFVIIRRGQDILVRTRTEKGSLYGGDLSGKKELPGGAVDVQDFGSGYDSAPIEAAARELKEETGLELLVDQLEKPIRLKPAWAIINEELIDLAFAIDVPWSAIKETSQYRDLLQNGNLAWIHASKLGEVEFISKRMTFLAVS